MERLYYIIIALVALFTGIILFIIGYRKLVYPKGSGKFSRELWLSTMVIMALLSAISCGKDEPKVTRTCYEPIPMGKQYSNDFRDLQKLWQEFTAHKAEINEDRLRQAQELLSRIQREQGFSAALIAATKWFVDTRVAHINRQFDGAKCYDMSPEGYNLMKTLNDLETQYALLEKMRAEVKIKPEVLNKVKDTIKDDCRELTDRKTNKTVMDGLSDSEKDRLVRFVMELSGIDPKQLKNGETEEPKDEGTKLEDQPEWKAITEQWDTVSQLTGSQKSQEELDAIRKETDKRMDDLSKLAGKGLIAASLVEMMRQDFSQMQQVAPTGVLCYKPAIISPQDRSWEHLQARLPLLEKALAEGRINPVAYQKVIIKLKQDLAALDDTGNENNMNIWKRYKQNRGLKDEDIEAVKKKAKELIDKIGTTDEHR